VVSPFSNQRRHRRFTVDIMEIQSRAVFACEVAIYDISISGVSLIADRRLDTGREYSIRIMDEDPDISLQGTVVWCSENESAICSDAYVHLKYAAGLKFTSLPQETRARLMTFIETHLIDRDTQVKVQDMSGRRCNVRFHAERSEKAMLNVAEAYRVRKLSLGGLQLESDHDFELETRMHMSITIPGDVQLTFTGRVASCNPSPSNPSHFDIGIEFIDMPEQEKIKLKALIRRLYLEDAGFTV
jgi:Tfp pilus assembly protein PilZ